MARTKRAETVAVGVRLTVEAADLLKQLAPSENRRGQYLSRLIMRAAQEAGLIEAPSSPDVLDLAILQHQLRSLQQRVEAALAQHEDAAGAESAPAGEEAQP